MSRAELQPDRAQIEQFFRITLKHADEGTFVSLRSFEHGAGTRPFAIKAVQVNGNLSQLVDVAVGMARAAAKARQGVVLAPPVATFSNPGHAAEADLANGTALSVECDQRPREGRQTLEGLLDPATVVVASGGEWTSPNSGEVEDKLHLHWVLNEPTRTPEEHAKLKLARKLATLLIGGDPTAVPAVHPLRLPGSWHRKGKPKLCRIIATHEDAELDLDEALDRLEAAAKTAGLSLEKVKANPGGEDRDTAELIKLITTGTEYLAPLVALSARYAGRGMSAKQIEMTLRGFMDAVPDAVRDIKDGKPQPGRWADRVANLGRIARSAVTKYGAKAEAPPKGKPNGEERPGSAEEPVAKAPEAVTRAEIHLTPEHWNRMLAQCADTLRNVLYMRGTVPVMLARAVETGGKEIEDRDGTGIDLNGVRYRPGSLLFMAAVPGRVAWYLDEHATFRRYVRREKEWVAQHCPKEVGASLVDAAIYLGFKPCAGIVHVPLLANGRLITTPGYHEPTGLILDLKGPPPELPQVLDKAAAEAAMERLLRPFRGFLKDGCVDRTAVATAALTAILRASLPTAPAILIDGNNPAVGKGKLARTLSALTTGGLPAVVTEGHSDEETEKRIASAVLQGAPVILLDNLQRHLASSTLESMLTEPVADIRTFGKLENLRVACRALVLMTANNASLRKDMLRRSVPVRIVVQDEKPELRSFDFDPVAEAARDRVELVAAAFTVVLAWLRERDRAENKPHRKPLGSFELWADLVGGAVSWLTGKNPVDLIEEQKEQSPQAADERRVINALVEWQGKLKDKKGHPRQWWYAKEAAAGLDAELWEGVIEAKGERPSARQVGKWLTRRKDAVFGDYILTGKPDRIGTMEWTCRVSQGMPNTPCEKWQNGESAKSYSANPTNPAKPGKPCKSPDPDDEEGFDL